jgi:predicted integral membrane protein DUF2269
MGVVAVIYFYDVVLFIHIGAVVIAFGATFAYPFFQAGVERVSPRSVPAMLRAMHTTSRYLVTPGSLVVLASGIYLTIERWDFGQLFVIVGLSIVIVVIILGGAFFDRHEARAIELAERDVAAAGAGEAVLSEEYWEVSKRFARVGMAASLLILVAVFFMAVKP